MPPDAPPGVPLAPPAADDVKHDAGLRGGEFTTAVVGLSLVFVLGLAVLVTVILSGRRKTP